MEDLGTLGGGYSATASFSSAMNDQGQVVGTAATGTGDGSRVPVDAVGRHAGPRHAGRPLPAAGRRARRWAINARGQVVGYAASSTGWNHAFRWTASRGMQDLGTLGGRESGATVINGRGQVAGYSLLADGDTTHPFRWTAVRRHAGSGHPRRGGAVAIPIPVATGINGRGYVVGSSFTAGGERHAYRWTPTGGMEDLGTLGGTDSSASAINARGQVTGTAATTDSRGHAFLWTP